MKLKDGINVRYDSSDKAYIFDFSKVKKIGKVTSRMFPILTGKSNWNGIGSGVLDRCGLLEFEDIDEFYTVRGAIGEYLVKLFIENTYKSKGIKVDVKAFESQISYDGGKTFYGNDMFKKNEKFGGALDLAIASPQELRAVIEVKSKSKKDFDYIAVKGNYPIEEVMQGEQLTVLSKVNKLLMAYIFFTEKQEQDLKDFMHAIENKKNFDVAGVVKSLNWEVKDFDFHMKKFDINVDSVQREMDKAYDNLHRIAKLGVIHEMHFTKQEVAYLDNVVREQTGQPIEEEPPF